VFHHGLGRVGLSDSGECGAIHGGNPGSLGVAPVFAGEANPYDETLLMKALAFCSNVFCLPVSCSSSAVQTIFSHAVRSSVVNSVTSGLVCIMIVAADLFSLGIRTRWLTKDHCPTASSWHRTTGMKIRSRP